jgi:predicted Zn-dependent protease
VTAKHHLRALGAKARSGALINLAASQIRGTASAFQGQIAQLGRNLYSSGLDQGDEYEADRQGVALAARAGFDPYGLPSVLQQLRSVPADNQLFTLTMATHPPAQARLDQLEGAMGNRLDALTGKPSVPVSQRLRR